MIRIAAASEACARACALAVYAIAAALVLVSASAILVSLFTGSETSRAGAGFVIMAAGFLAGTAWLTTRR